MIYVDFPVHGEPAILAAEAAHCAGKQDAFWAYHDLLFERQFEEEITVENLKKFAAELVLDADGFATCLDSNEFRDFVIAQLQQSQQIGLQGTPSFIIRPSAGDAGGQFIPGLVSFDQMKEIIDQELAKATGKDSNASDSSTP